jgi:hypothetical protein
MGTFFVALKLVLVCTIDTDSIAIELMHQSAKNVQRLERRDLPEPMKTILCFRETTGKRRDPSLSKPVTQFACFDIAQTHYSLMSQLSVPRGMNRHATALLSAAWALCGSDFVHFKGMRSDVAFDAVLDLCASEEAVNLLQAMEAVWELKQDTDPSTIVKARADMLIPISRVVSFVEARLTTMPRMARAVSSIRGASDDEYAARSMLLRGAWCAVYWSGLQCPDSELVNWGFPARNLTPM